ncbi:uncharacterized protein LOC116790608 [Chiroxiphia lanceolata]|uniref:uncharacterized protein LOC116790608 n=1 Tax=Chiroxiphia lanceolata TaxID=296741 RepID=UPI0013CEA1FC|nr:uncharacterized protein LOC116790608 [Chiroxiphia lanceolata]
MPGAVCGAVCAVPNARCRVWSGVRGAQCPVRCQVRRVPPRPALPCPALPGARGAGARAPANQPRHVSAPRHAVPLPRPLQRRLRARGGGGKRAGRMGGRILTTQPFQAKEEVIKGLKTAEAGSIAGVEAIRRDGECDVILQSAHGIHEENLSRCWIRWMVWILIVCEPESKRGSRKRIKIFVLPLRWKIVVYCIRKFSLHFPAERH